MKQIRKSEFNRAQASLSATRLPEKDKRAMLSRIYEAAGAAAPKPSPWSFSFAASYRYAAAVCLFVLLATGTAYAAAGSLPGDALYDVKTRLVEPLALAVHRNPERQNAYKITLLQRRIQELEALKASGRISTESEYESHVAAQKNVADIEKSPVFNEAGVNVEVSTYINSYNEIVSEDLKLKTAINLSANAAAAGTSSIASLEEASTTAATLKEPIEAAAAAVKDTIETTASGTKTTVPAVAEPIKETIAPVQEAVGAATAPIQKTVTPVIDRLGL